jgi:hypothetical protein
MCVSALGSDSSGSSNGVYQEQEEEIPTDGNTNAGWALVRGMFSVYTRRFGKGSGIRLFIALVLLIYAALTHPVTQVIMPIQAENSGDDDGGGGSGDGQLSPNAVARGIISATASGSVAVALHLIIGRLTSEPSYSFAAAANFLSGKYFNNNKRM